jgi:glutamate--cysteine ligase
MLLTDNSTDLIFNKNQLAEIFFSGCKMKQSIGVESEKLLVYKQNNKAITYNDAVKILNNFNSEKWQKIYENGNLTSLKGDIGTITLEPGSQIELSLAPFESLEKIVLYLTDFYNQLSLYADKIGAMVLDYGIQPISTYNDIKVIPKKRYEFMTKYLPSKGLTPFVMMRETAGIQANFDYKSEIDAIKKLSLALKMSPIISAIYSNSPIHNGKFSNYKSYRANSWLNVDEDRCGYISPKLFEKQLNFTFSDYVERGNEYYQTKITFREFMKNGFVTLKATLTDWQNHISLYFPDVRLKSYIEIRNHDAQNATMTFSVPAFWKGIMYNPDAMEEINKILAKYSYEDFMELRKNSPIYGINAKLGEIKIIDFVKEFFDISYSSLKENKLNEEKYLDCVYEYISLKRMPSDNFN